MSCNLHTHTCYCDGSDTPRQLAEAAIAKGFDCLGFSGHSYTFFDEDYCMSPENTQKYREEISALKAEYSGRLKILMGIEQDIYSKESTCGYDYIIGSAHYIYKDGVYCPIDGSPEEQKATVDLHWNGDWYAYCRDYYALAGQIPEKTGCHIVGHFDLVTKFNEKCGFFDEADPGYLEAAFGAVDKALERCPVFEVNTGAMARGCRSTPYPGRAIADYIVQRGGRLILTSDCHSRDKLDYGFDTILPYLRHIYYNFNNHNPIIQWGLEEQL